MTSFLINPYAYADAGGGGGSTPEDDFAAVAHLAWDLEAEGFTDGTDIGTLTDQTANGHDASQGTGALQPLAKDRGTGDVLKVAEFTRANGDTMETAAFASTASQPNTYIFLAKLSTTGTANYQFFDGRDSGARNSMYAGAGFWYYLGASPTSTGDTQDQAWHVFVGLFDGASSQFILDGVNIHTGNVGTSGVDGIQLGSRNDGANNLEGDIAYFGMYDGDLLTDDLALLNDLGQALRDRADAAGLTIAAWTDIT